MADITQTTYAATREDWRRWLEENHASVPEIWLLFYKKNSGVQSVKYDEAVEEALCFGWIDSIVKRVDEEKYAQKFTPRRNNNNWSDVNQRRVAKLFREGKMTEAGMAKLNFNPAEIDPDAPLVRKEWEAPEFFLQALEGNPKAFENFQNMPPSQKRYYIAWISDAKREETRQKRTAQALEMLEQNKKLGM